MEAKLKQVELLITYPATVVEPETRLSVMKDEPDNRVLKCAVAPRASAMVTGDKRLPALEAYEGVGVMTVAEPMLYSFPETS